MQTTRESSVLFSLRELRDLEQQRVADEARAEQERLAAAEAARSALEEKRRREELGLRLGAEARARVLAERLAATPAQPVEPAPVEPPAVSLRPRRSLVPWIVAGLVTVTSVAWAFSREPEMTPPPPAQVVVRTVYLEPPPPPAPIATVVVPATTPSSTVKPTIIKPPVVVRKPTKCEDPRDPLCELD